MYYTWLWCNNCRLCKSNKLIDVIFLGEQYITSRFPNYSDFSTPKSEIVLCICEECYLLQLKVFENQNELYEYEYVYRSGINNTMKRHLKSYNDEILLYWANQMVQKGIGILSLADTIGIASEAQISFALETLIPKYTEVTIGVHLHSTSKNWKAKLEASINAGCKRFDGSLKGIGGCPMAQDELIGNMDTELMIPYFEEQNLLNNLDKNALQKCSMLASEIFV